MTKLSNGLVKSIDAVLISGGSLVCAVVFANVLARYFLNFDLAWVNEFGETVFVWLTFLGSARAVRSHAHLAVIEFVERFPSHIGRKVFVALWLLTAGILLGLVWFGIGIAIANMDQSMSVTGWPVGILYWAMPVGAALALVFVIEQIVRGEDFRTLAAAAHAVAED